MPTRTRKVTGFPADPVTPEPWPGHNRWVLAQQRGHTLTDPDREEWEDERTFHLRHHLLTWCESLRTGVLTLNEAIASIEGLFADVREWE